MNSKERVLAVLEGRLPDRVPLMTFGIDPKFIRKFGGGTFERTLETLGLDVYPLYSQNWCQGIPLNAALSQEIPESMQTSGGTYGGWDGCDEFGRIWKRGSYVGGVVRSEEEIGRYVPELKLEERIDPGRIKTLIKKHPDKAFCFTSHTGPFGLTMESIGFEEFFYLYMDNRAFIEKLIWERTKWFAEVAAFGVELGADLILMGDDAAFKQRTFIAPTEFDALMVPCYQYIAKKVEIPLLWHSDGYIVPLLETAVKSGIRGVHSLEPTAGVDLSQVKKDYGDRLILAGNIDCGVALCQENLDLVRAEVNRCMEQAKEGGGYILSDSNSIHSGCSPEAVLEMFRYAREVGGYTD
ncbi:MAG: hypothetical protein HY879_22665 [Deltaproteobacteria bacterium]|nr:hypothetical protein [Deltaproteobacteria bacterium]